jgi:hypothetical protein
MPSPNSECNIGFILEVNNCNIAHDKLKDAKNVEIVFKIQHQIMVKTSKQKCFGNVGMKDNFSQHNKNIYTNTVKYAKKLSSEIRKKTVMAAIPTSIKHCTADCQGHETRERNGKKITGKYAAYITSLQITPPKMA